MTDNKILLVLMSLFLLLSVPACSSSSGGDEADVCSCEADAECTAVTPACQEIVTCETDDNCISDSACVAGTCTDGVCSFALTGGDGCCTVDMDCDDVNTCTTDSCNLVTGMCEYHMPDTNCCTTDPDCDDLNPCTQDKCEEGQCTATALSSCCQTNAECNDLDPCTDDLCLMATGKCVNPVDANIAGCDCNGTDDCDDGNICSVESCLNSQCHYDLFLNASGLPNPGCCDQDSDCDDSDATTIDRCVLYICINQHARKCMVDEQCDDGDACTNDVCLGGYCKITDNEIPGCCAVDIDCNDDSECTVDSCVDNVCAYSYNAGQAGCCSSDAECNDNITCTTDQCNNHKCEWDAMGTDCCHDASDCPVATLPCTQAKCAQGTCSIETLTNCCEQDTECNDGNACTTDDCDNGSCYYWPIESCCTTDNDCDDENVCTIDQCQNGTCQDPVMVANCCSNAGQCNDQDACTTDTCVDNKCVYEERLDCCHSDAECESEKEIDCQIPHCQNGVCIMELGQGCCLQDGDCDDGYPICTVDLCIDNACVYELADEEGCCIADSDCTSVDPCLAATCKSNHQCDYAPILDCCKEDEECDDGDDTCTIDACVANRCAYELTFAENCCLSNDDCDSPDICQAPLCNTGTHQCYLEDIDNCCHNDGECSDGEDTCTVDECQADRCVHIYTGASGCCTMDSQCPAADVCDTGHCNVEDGTCYYEPIPGCCHTDLDCNDMDDVCTTDTCVNNECKYTFTGAPGCCEPLTWERNFDDGTDGGLVFENAFSMSDLLSDPMIGMLLQMMGITNLSLGWQITKVCGNHSPEYALHYGMEPMAMLGSGNCSYGLDLLGGLISSQPTPIFDLGSFANSGSATSATISLPADQGHHLRFWLKMDISDATDADEFTIEVVVGGNATQVWSKADLASSAYGTWTLVEIDLADFSGDDIQLRFFFDTLGGTGTGGVGILIDDMSLTADCNP